MSKRRRLSSEDYVIGWVCALPIELAAAEEMLDEVHEDVDTRSSHVYTLGRVGDHNVVLACLPKGQMGTNSAATVAAQLRSSFPSMCFGVMVGIGGGVPSASADVRLGDVVVSLPGTNHGGVLQYDFGKTTPGGLQRTGFLNAPPTVLLEAVSKVQANHIRGQTRFRDYISHFNALPMFTAANFGGDTLFDADYQHVGGGTCDHCRRERVVSREARNDPVIHYGTIASGNLVMRDGVERDRVSSELGGVLCFEMEAAGLMNTFPCLVIRGICDYADSHKNKDWQPYAAATAAAYTKDLLLVIPQQAVAKTKIMAEDEKRVVDEALKHLPFAVDATFNSYHRQHEPLCLPSTRVDLLHQITDWLDREDKCGIFWLNGWAGTGKSTIARTIARKCHEGQRLGATFFFSRGGGDIGHAGKFVTTVARQLASNIPNLQRLLCNAVSQSSDIGSLSLSDQWRQLVLRPLSELVSSNRSCLTSYALVIDALDECDDDRNIRIILQLLSEAQTVENNMVRVFITSRPIPPIEHGFSRISETSYRILILHHVPQDTLAHDIRAFLEYELGSVAEEQSLGPHWPSLDAIGRLAEGASGLFIWCATACRFISEGGIFAMDRLSSLLEGSTTDTGPEGRLNEIYGYVLKASIPSTFTMREQENLYYNLRQVLGTVVILFSPLCLTSICRLIQSPERMTENMLRRLNAIIDVPSDPCGPLSLHHPSFRDFLLDDQRCTDANLSVNRENAHYELLNSCLRLMNSELRKDICGVGRPGTSRDEINDHHIQKHLSTELQYACLFWVHHLRISKAPLEDDTAVHCFLMTRLLHWVEAVSWVGKLAEAIQEILVLESIASENHCPRLSELIWNTKRLVQANQFILEHAPLQIYLSACVFAPSSSLIRTYFKDAPLQWMKKLPNVRKYWGSLQQAIECYPETIQSVIFSPNGEILAAKTAKSVRLLDPSTGRSLHTLQGQDGEYRNRLYYFPVVNMMAFSPDGKILATIFYLDTTVSLWDVLTGQCVQTLRGHTDKINQVAYSCDGKILASVSDDYTCRLWDTHAGRCTRLLKGHTDHVSTVVFSPSPRFANILASASNDHTVRVWNALTGECLHIFKMSIHRGFCPLAFSPNGELLAAVGSGGPEGHDWPANKIQLWNPLSGKHQGTLEASKIYMVMAIVFSPDGKILGSSAVEEVRLWDPLSGRCMETVHHRTNVPSIAFSPDATTLASAGDDGIVRVWTPLNAQSLQSLQGHTRSVEVVAFSPCSDRKRALLASASADGTLVLWDASEKHEGQIGLVAHGVTVSPDGRTLASWVDTTVQLWDLGTVQCLRTFDCHGRHITVAAFSPDGRKLAIYAGKLHLWDLSTGRLLHILDGDTDDVYHITFSAGGDRVIFRDYRTIEIWDMSTACYLQKFDGFTSVRAVAFSANADKLVSFEDKAMCVWDVSTAQCLQSINRGDSRHPKAIAWSPNGMHLALAAYRTVLIWNLSSGQCVQKFAGDLSEPSVLAFSADSNLFASAPGHPHLDWMFSRSDSRNNCLQVWNTFSGECLYVVEDIPAITSLSFSEDCRYLKTSLGTLTLDPALKSGDLRTEKAPGFHGLFVRNAWITWKGQNLLWLPAEYRPKYTAVYENVVAIVCSSGQLIFLEFDLGTLGCCLGSVA
ncbi:WD40-repeat-containing domain protein [Aspergillus pseudoustus]|uniref:WD40-repeat-containing domain protein n=1 Tax=Aspergillus pseudoustus TaxID=1810923 RepID=A0ABR4K0T2_9EURO